MAQTRIRNGFRPQVAKDQSLENDKWRSLLTIYLSCSNLSNRSWRTGYILSGAEVRTSTQTTDTSSTSSQAQASPARSLYWQTIELSEAPICSSKINLQCSISLIIMYHSLIQVKWSETMKMKISLNQKQGPCTVDFLPTILQYPQGILYLLKP